MSMTFSKLARLFVIAMIVAFAAGCASTGALKEVRAEAQRAQATANEAKAMASDALNAANSAQAGVDALNEKVDRMFSRSMRK